MVLSAGSLAAQTNEPVEGPLSMTPVPQHAPANLVDNDTLIRMAKAGIGDEILIQTIQLQPGHYDSSPDALILLKQSGISDRVISTLLAHGTGLAVRRTPSSMADPIPDNTNAPTLANARVSVPPSGVDEIGVYYKDKSGRWQPMETEVVHIKSGGFIKSTLTHNIIKEDRNGVVTGQQSKLLLWRPCDFLIDTPDGVQGTEYDLLRFRLNSKDREFRTLTGGVIHQTGGAQRDEVPFTPVKVGPHVWTFSIPKDLPGAEYGILPPGTGNVTNGGKIYTFAISE